MEFNYKIILMEKCLDNWLAANLLLGQQPNSTIAQPQ